MAIRRYLAMTALEIGTNSAKMADLAYMACHFSPYGRDLSNLPLRLPRDAMVILNDRIPISGHDPQLIQRQLQELILRLNCSRVLLDFQRPGDAETARVVQALENSLPCPIGVSHWYAKDTSCPVFLPPLPPDKRLAEHLTPWEGREIWMEEAPSGLEITVTERGGEPRPLCPAVFPESGHRDETLHCHSRVETFPDRAVFQIWRTEDDWDSLAREAEALGVTCRIGLWQEWQ